MGENGFARRAAGTGDVGKSIKDKSYGRMHLNLPAVIECLHITWRVLKSPERIRDAQFMEL